MSMAKAMAKIEELTRGLAAVESLISESEGVAGLHRNGDIAPWDELLEGGQFEDWLIDFSKALEPTKSSSEGESSNAG